MYGVRWCIAVCSFYFSLQLKTLREQQELAAVQTLEAAGRTEEVVTLLLRLKKKYALTGLIQRRLLRSLSLPLDAAEPAALLRKGDTAKLLKMVPQQLQQQVALLLQQQLPQQLLQQQQQQQDEGGDDDWGGLIERLGPEEARTLFCFVAEWTADPTTSAAAHGLLHLLLQRTPLDVLFEGFETNSSNNSSKGSKGTKELALLNSGRDKRVVGDVPMEKVLNALIVNCQRQERRIAGLLQKSYLLDLLLPGATAVQQELQQLLLPLQQQQQQGKGGETSGDIKAPKKKRKLLQQQQQQEQQQQEQQQQQQQQEFLLSDEALSPHFGASFTERCLYGDDGA